MNNYSLPQYPYCGYQLDNLPKRKRKCPSCSNQILIRRFPNQEQPIFVTQEEAIKIDKERDKIFEQKQLRSKISKYGFTEEELNKTKRDYYEKNKSEMRNNDAIWSMFNSRVMELNKVGNYSDASILYYQMALFLAQEERKNPLHILQASNKPKLLGLKQQGIKKITISYSGNGCNNCKKLNSKIYEIEFALEKSTLPNINCSFDAFDTGYPFCRCIYLPVV